MKTKSFLFSVFLIMFLPITLLYAEEQTKSLKTLPLLDEGDLYKYSKPAEKKKTKTGLNREIKEGEAIPLDTDNLKFFSYFKTIKKQIARVRSYPEAAKEHFLKGKASVQFTLLKDGSVEDIKILKSTGHNILDENAMRTIKTAAPFNPFPKRIEMSKISVVADLDYYPNITTPQEDQDFPAGIGIPLKNLKDAVPLDLDNVVEPQ